MSDPLSRLMELHESATEGPWTKNGKYPFEVCDANGEAIGEYMLSPSRDVANTRITVAAHNLMTAFVEVARAAGKYHSGKRRSEKCPICNAVAALDATIEKELGDG